MSLTERREGIAAGRLDMFVDGAFALTLTVLVIGGESTPRSSAQLMHVMGGIPAFAASFAMIGFFWHGHVRWRQLCHAASKHGLVLSLLLVFFALIFVYPLHMMFAGIFNAITGGLLPSEFRLSSSAPLRTLFICYGLAFTCMAGTVSALYAHAVTHALRAGRAGFEARREQLTWLVPAVLGLLSALLAVLIPLSANSLWWMLPGWIYALMFLIGPLNARLRRRHEQALLADPRGPA